MFLLKIYKNINAKEKLVAGWDPKGNRLNKLNKFVNKLKNIFNLRTLNTIKAVA